MKEQIKFKEFQINSEIIDTNIYKGQKRQIDSVGIEMSEEIDAEVTLFLEEYTEFLLLPGKKVFFRIDAYFDKNKLFILDMNASFVDGWGVALNFARSIGQKINTVLINNFPKNLKLEKEQYRPEFELCLKELNILFFDDQVNGFEKPDFNEVSEINSNNETYIYGDTDNVGENIFPYNGKEVDNKINLAGFSKIWKGDLVKIPDIILPSELNYSQLPNDIVLKIASKNDIREDGRNKVFIGKPKKWGKMWEEGMLVAQEKINPLKNSNGENTQAIIMSLGTKAITGYVQNSTRNIINDNSIQSPLTLG